MEIQTKKGQTNKEETRTTSSPGKKLMGTKRRTNRNLILVPEILEQHGLAGGSENANIAEDIADVGADSGGGSSSDDRRPDRVAPASGSPGTNRSEGRRRADEWRSTSGGKPRPGLWSRRGQEGLWKA